jgi:hypothetical protein
MQNSPAVGNGLGGLPRKVVATPVAPRGEVAFTVPGTYSWVVPTGVTSISFVLVGGGGGGAYSGSGGGGGALAYKNSLTVVPGDTLTIVVGAGGVATVSTGLGGATSLTYGTASATAGGGKTGTTDSDFGYDTASAGQISSSNMTGVTGFRGGYGGPSNINGNGFEGGGGAGGYSGVGGNGFWLDSGNATQQGTSGAGGGGAGGGTSANGGGGVGLYGLGSNGAYPSGGGSGGQAGQDNRAGVCGGGAGATYQKYSQGANGGARIVWPGTTRQFPSTDVSTAY